MTVSCQPLNAGKVKKNPLGNFRNSLIIKHKKSPPIWGAWLLARSVSLTHRPLKSLVSTSGSKNMATIDSTVASVRILEHYMTRSRSCNLGREYFSLLAIFDKKRSEPTFERINDIL